MILNNAPQAEAVLSNVGEIGEFRIRNSAKAFNILSSGLYANKIRAIIRELSCNALDSHVAAGTDQPFEVHLPTTLEPFFSIRDFGTGLTHEQVTNIYTTYFESTKTNSNAFIGALGLGSKSPFSYTDNFTVIAIKDGHKGIYSAFINDQGVPSIALMGGEDTTEPAGVEIKFSVNERHDFGKFQDEASRVYRWFKQRPKFTGAQVNNSEIKYETKDIIPGVHSVEGATNTVAVMGNIAYPVEVPESAKSELGSLASLLKCGLVIEFGIGELDFQASREGLSYIPQTIQAIKSKLEALNDALTTVLATEANAIENKWKRSQFLHTKNQTTLWYGAVTKYVNDTDFKLMDNTGRRQYIHRHTLDVYLDELKKFNIKMDRIDIQGNRCIAQSARENYSKDVNGLSVTSTYHNIHVEEHALFMVNDTNKGAIERTKYHYRNTVAPKSYNTKSVYLLSKIDTEKEMDLVGFYDAIHNPPDDQKFKVSGLLEKPRNASVRAKNVTLLKLQVRGHGGYYAERELVWRDAGKVGSLDAKETHYYIPLSGYTALLTNNRHSINELVTLIRETGLPEFKMEVYGVRKGDMKTITEMPNWVNLETYLQKAFAELKPKAELATVLESLDEAVILKYNLSIVSESIVNEKSPAKIFLSHFSGLPTIKKVASLNTLMRAFGFTSDKSKHDSLVKAYNARFREFENRYPLVEHLKSSCEPNAIGHYINLVDQVKGV